MGDDQNLSLAVIFYQIVVIRNDIVNTCLLYTSAVMDYINERRNCHILTIEDPVEYVYQRKQALIHQREIGRDGDSFDTCLLYTSFAGGTISGFQDCLCYRGSL